ncbi:MAG: hypothetical protein QW680_13145 [Pyrobaculum sp.]|uniref:hypothetical protein n=1 Tax=Pyrobaculum arsenaticum TaxID=121277 RepID=UPI000A4001A0|nr:hypothetical protein [Pyrobaculum arsenaticum]
MRFSFRRNAQNYIGKLWDKNDNLVDAAVVKIEKRSTMASPPIELCGYSGYPQVSMTYFSDSTLKSYEGQVIYNMYRIGHLTGYKGGKARIYYYEPTAPDGRPYCLLVIYYDPEWKPTQQGDSGSPLLKVSPIPRTPYVLVTITGIFTSLRPADNPPFIEFRAVECVNKFYGVVHRYGE